MHGFQSSAVRKMAGPQRLADGGLIRSIFGGGPKETVSEKFARQDAERAAKQAAKAPAPAPAPAPASAISDYAGMSAMQRREKAAGLKDGGPVAPGIIRGPGTGTSDSISGKMPAGSFVMPADSTEVLVSNGETNFTPEAVQAVGVAALTAMRDATHTPTPEQEPENQFADGGEVEAERLRRVAQIPTGGAVAPPPDGSQNQITNNEFGRNLNNATNAVVPGVGAGAVRTIAVADRIANAGALAAKSPRFGAVAPYLPPAAGAAAIASGAGASTEQSAPATTLPAVRAVAPAMLSAGTSTDVQRGGSADVRSTPFAGIQKTVRSDGRVLYSDGNETADASLMARGPISAQNQAAGDALGARQAEESLARVRAAAPQPTTTNGPVAAGPDTGGFGILDKTYQRNRNMGFNTPAQNRAIHDAGRLDATVRADDTTRRGQDVTRAANEATAANSSAVQRLAEARFGMDSRNSAVDAQLKGTQLQGAQQLQAAQAAVTSAQTPEARASAVENLRTLQGKYEREAPELYDRVQTGVDSKTGAPIFSIYNKRTGQMAEQPSAPALPPKDKLVKGQTYPTPRGNAVWDGTKFTIQ